MGLLALSQGGRTAVRKPERALLAPPWATRERRAILLTRVGGRLEPSRI